jgi:hypothetical protein
MILKMMLVAKTSGNPWTSIQRTVHGVFPLSPLRLTDRCDGYATYRAYCHLGGEAMASSAKSQTFCVSSISCSSLSVTVLSMFLVLYTFSESAAPESSSGGEGGGMVTGKCNPNFWENNAP